MDAETDDERRDGEQRPGSYTAQGSAQVEAEQAPLEAQDGREGRRESGEPVDRVEAEEGAEKAQPGLRHDRHGERDEEELGDDHGTIPGARPRGTWPGHAIPKLSKDVAL
jgi:hypothetical protein